MVACVIAMKFNNDSMPKNEYLAKIGGVKKPELSVLEKTFCELINYNLCVK